jgi:hypothetical protein
MNYFDVFELPLQLSIDKVALKKKFFALSRQHHPIILHRRAPNGSKPHWKHRHC